MLLKLGPAAKPAVAELLAGAKAAVQARDWALAEPFIQALLAIDPASVRPVWPAVAAALKDDKPAVRRQALASVARIRPPADLSLVEALAAMLADKDGSQASSAAVALANMGQTPGETLSVLTRTMKFSNSRPYAELHALAALGPAARPAMPDLVRLLRQGRPAGPEGGPGGAAEDSDHGCSAAGGGCELHLQGRRILPDQAGRDG